MSKFIYTLEYFFTIYSHIAQILKLKLAQILKLKLNLLAQKLKLKLNLLAQILKLKLNLLAQILKLKLNLLNLLRNLGEYSAVQVLAGSQFLYMVFSINFVS